MNYLQPKIMSGASTEVLALYRAFLREGETLSIDVKYPYCRYSLCVDFIGIKLMGALCFESEEYQSSLDSPALRIMYSRFLYFILDT